VGLVAIGLKCPVCGAEVQVGRVQGRERSAG